MNVQRPAQMDQEAFLAWVQGREERFELERGRVIMMTGGSRAHWQITFNLAKAFDARLDAKQFAVLPEFGINVGPRTIRFPDIVVDVAGQSLGDLKASAPVLIAEVLSPSSERIDLGDKAAEYLRLSSLRAYLVVAQDEMKAWLWIRDGKEFAPSAEVLQGRDAVVHIAPLKIDVPFAAIYDRVGLE
jgi:Uma2 family endonuclease